MNHYDLRQQRLNELLDSCQEQMIAAIIGPFGLSKAMFDDKDGGNVTTVHNFEKGVTATAEDAARHAAWLKAKTTEGYDRAPYDQELGKKRKDLFKSEEPIISAYTGKELPRDGRTHLDHVVPAKELETNASSALSQSKEERVAMGNQEANLRPAEDSINMSMSDREKMEWSTAQRKNDPGKTNAESFGVDMQSLEETSQRARRKVERDISVAKTKKYAKELSTSSAINAGKSILQAIFSEVLNTFVTATISELKILMRARGQDNLIERLIESFKRIKDQVLNRLADIKDNWKAAIGGAALKSIVNDLMTFLINTVLTTPKKIIPILRNSTPQIISAIRARANPPPSIDANEVNRIFIKALGTIIGTSIGFAIDASLQTFLTTIPMLAPIAGKLSTVISGIITGVTNSLLIYGIDRIFDWYNSDPTGSLKAIEANVEEMSHQTSNMFDWIDTQYNTSQAYLEISKGYEAVNANLAASIVQNSNSLLMLETTYELKRQITYQAIEDQKNRSANLDELEHLLEGNNNEH